MSNKKQDREKAKPKPEPEAEKKTSETVHLSAEELRKISGGSGAPVQNPHP
jgi:hypothetical protein